MVRKMDENTKEQLIERKAELKRKIMIYEWDKKHKQINFAHMEQLENLKKELEDIENKLIFSKNESENEIKVPSG